MKRERALILLLTQPAIRHGAQAGSLYGFVLLAWHIVEPEVTLIPTWHIQAICDTLQAVYEGRLTRVIINVPPGSAKSIISSVLFPAWIWTKEPGYRSIYASYSINLAKRDSRRTRDLIKSDWYQRTFVKGKWAVGDWDIKNDNDKTEEFENSRTGFRIATSVKGGATGKRGKLVVIDDPLKAKDGRWSETARNEVNTWFGEVMSSRFNIMSEARVVIIMQRLHYDDLSGYLLRKGGWTHLCIPLEFNSASRCVIPGVFCDPRNDNGEVMFPRYWTPEVIEQMKLDMGGSYSGQANQSPVNPGEAIFKRLAVGFYKQRNPLEGWAPFRPDGCSQAPAVELPLEFDSIGISIDAAFKQTSDSSFVVMQAWGKKKADRFLLEQLRRRMGFVDTITAMKAFCNSYPRAVKLVEDKANGPAIIDAMHKVIPGLMAVEPEGSKVARAQAVSIEWDSGNVYIPDGPIWTNGFLEELEQFPLGGTDDQVDAMTQMLNHWNKGQTREGWRRMIGTLR